MGEFVLVMSVLLGSFSARAESVVEDLAKDTGADSTLLSQCDPGEPLTLEERKQLIDKLRISIAGRGILSDFVRQYGALKNLLIQWDSVSYSQVTNSRKPEGRAPAGEGKSLGEAVCVHLTRKLPQIEHVADLAHELTHATRLEQRVLKGEVQDVDEFVRARLTARGGEAEAFAAECRVKNELLGSWDTLCAPYALTDHVDIDRVVHDLYNGQLSASLTGEAYPVMLSRQYRAMLTKKAARRDRDLSGIQ